MGGGAGPFTPIAPPAGVLASILGNVTAAGILFVVADVDADTAFAGGMLFIASKIEVGAADAFK